MKIKRLQLVDFYGFMNKNIVFNETINLLVGINGCGKTTVLNVINWILTLSIADFCVNEFKKVVLTFFAADNTEYRIEILQSEQKLSFILVNVNEHKIYPKIVVFLSKNPKFFTRNEQLRKEYRESYNNLKPDGNEIITWNKLHELFKTVVEIGLNREYKNDDMNDVRHKRTLKYTQEPIISITELANRAYNTYKSRKITLNQMLNNSIMMASFNKVYNENELNTFDIKKTPKLREISIIEEKVLNYFMENSISRDRQSRDLNKIRSYFADMKDMIKDSSDKYSLSFIMNLNQIDMITSLINEFENFEERSNAIYNEIETYLNVINSFLVDSAKRIYFTKDAGELKYSLLDENGNDIDNNRDVCNLSSGEKQILIQFTYLAFLKKGKPIFIIDEPELSLHPKWLESYLPSIEKIISNKTQIFIATHSPVIVASKKENCIVLLPYND